MFRRNSKKLKWRGGYDLVPSYPNFEKEEDRLASFTEWNNDVIPAPSMAKAGFYYLRMGDTVRCAFCGIHVGKWQPGDDPISDHRLFAPNCRYIKQFFPSPTPYSEEGFDVCGPFGTEIHHRDKSTQTEDTSSNSSLLSRFFNWFFAKF